LHVNGLRGEVLRLAAAHDARSRRPDGWCAPNR